jgi:DNA replication and repair protein RecF
LALSRVRITALRCVAEAALELDAGRNYIYGPNGAGKTSLLEAIFVLGRGRSFRSRQTGRLVRHGQPGFSVYGEVTAGGRTHRIGVAFARGHLTKRVDGEEAAGMAALAEVLPVYALDPGSHQLVEGGPSERRRFLDWGVFHVEPQYLEVWKRYRRVLGQRNAALKAGTLGSALRTWTDALIETGAAVDQSRRAYLDRLKPLLLEFGQRLLGQPLAVAYRPGWPPAQSLESALAASERKDLLSRTTEVGPHRADLEIELAGRRLQDEASRGQQKLAAAAMTLAQLAAGATDTRAAKRVLLVDDPAAELDRHSLGRLLELLSELPAQLVITGLSVEQLPPAPGFPVFHVERGEVRAV